MISNSQFFILGVTTTILYNLQMYKITFSLTSVSWSNQIVCPSGTWSASYSESVLNTDGSTVYSFFTFGATTYLYFVGLSVSDGSIKTTRFKSSASVTYVWGSALNGDYVVNLKLNIQINCAQLHLNLKYKFDNSTNYVNLI